MVVVQDGDFHFRNPEDRVLTGSCYVLFDYLQSSKTVLSDSMLKA